MYTFDGPRRHLAHAAAGEHRFGDPRLHRAPARPAARRAEALLHGPDVPPRAAAEGPLPAVLPDRRGGHRLGIARGGCRSDRDGGGDPRSAPGSSGFQLLLNSVGDPNCRPQYVERLREELRGRGAADVRRLPAPRRDQSAARARLQGGGRPAHHRQAALASSITCATPAARTSTPCSSTWPTAASNTKCGRAWCAASTTTCARRSKWCTARWARRIRCWAAAATTAWPNRSARKCTRPGIGFSIGEDRLVMSVEGEQPPAPLDLFIAPLGEPALRHAAVLARDLRRAGRLGGTGAKAS